MVDWDHFAEKLLICFKKRMVLGPAGRLSKLLQTSTVGEFQSRFEALSTEIVSLPEEFMVECFLSGLHPDIQSAVVAHEPTILERTISLAHIQEQRIAYEKGPVTPTPNYT